MVSTGTVSSEESTRCDLRGNCPQDAAVDFFKCHWNLTNLIIKKVITFLFNFTFSSIHVNL